MLNATPPCLETEPIDLLPPALRIRLEELRPILLVQGCVQAKRDGGALSYRLRYRELDPELQCKRHKAITLGRDEAVAHAVRSLIKRWRNDIVRSQEAERLRIANERIEMRKTALLIEMVGRSLGRGKCIIERTLKQYRYYMRTDQSNLWFWLRSRTSSPHCHADTRATGRREGHLSIVGSVIMQGRPALQPRNA